MASIDKALLIKTPSAEKKRKIYSYEWWLLIGSGLLALLLMGGACKLIAVRVSRSARTDENEQSESATLDHESADPEHRRVQSDVDGTESSPQRDWKYAIFNNGVKKETDEMTIVEGQQSKFSHQRKAEKATPKQQQKLTEEGNEDVSRKKVNAARINAGDDSSSVGIAQSKTNPPASIRRAELTEIQTSGGFTIPDAKDENPEAFRDDLPSRGETDLVPRYSLGKPITNWDRKRQLWQERHPRFGRYTEDGGLRMFILTGSQPSPCPDPRGDHLLLRCFKNKVDYSRLHGIEIFYNMALLDPDMPSFWAKLPLVRATMLSHPEVEWIWWVDLDAIVTDMEFEIPLEKYEHHNFVVFGWEHVVYEERSWFALNAGSFLIRNCQWSLDFMERWASMGPQGPLGEAFAHILSDFFLDRQLSPTDDQSALIYLLNREREVWGEKVFLETSYYLHGYWLPLVDTYAPIEEMYEELERQHQSLRRRRDGEREEKMASKYARMRETYLRNATIDKRRPFVTHFTGCQPCTGWHNKIYEKNECLGGMDRALNYADDQVLLSYGFKHRNLEVPDVERLHDPFT